MTLNWKIAINIIVIVIGTVAILPNFVNMGDTSWLSSRKLKYGLDIQGGIHLVMGVDVEAVLKEQTHRMVQSLEQSLKDDKISVMGVERDPADGMQSILIVGSPEEIPKVKEAMGKSYGTALQIMAEKDNKIYIRLTDYYSLDVKKRTLDQAIETLRNRVDEFGLTEPSITAQGDDRILIQLPGLEPEAIAKAKDLINRTAKLSFMLVRNDKNIEELSKIVSEAEAAGKYSLATLKYGPYAKRLNEDVKTKLPPNTQILFAKQDSAKSMDVGRIPYLLETLMLGGEDLKDTHVSTQNDLGQPRVSMSFSPDGGRRFGEITTKYVKRQVAIILDDVVYSAPVIDEPIKSGSAEIRLGGRNYEDMMTEAKTISIVLRAGALPASLTQLEERTVGPALGADSIAKGKKATVVGCLLVFVFILFYYKTMGIIANIALVLNLFLLLSIMTSLEATLTLPGIAGIALTIGMAVDANVLVNEAIKEALRHGASFRASVQQGYRVAFSSILDSHMTTIVTSIFLIYFGTGPVRGFGVSLTAGLVVSMFTSLFTTHTIIDVLTQKLKREQLWI